MTIRVSALGRSIQSKVVRFTRDLSLDTRTMQTEVDVPNRDLSLTPGMYANTYLQLAHREDVLTVPLAAIQGDSTTETVMVVDSRNRLEPRAVHVGLRGSVLAEIKDGLVEGDRVVLGDSGELKPGDAVTPRMEPEPNSDIMHEEGGMIDPEAAQKPSLPSNTQDAKKGSNQ